MFDRPRITVSLSPCASLCCVRLSIMSGGSVAVVMVGGPSTSNFRALGSVPAPLFPLAGRPLLDHPLRAAAAVPGLTCLFVVGFYDERDFSVYLSSLSVELGLPVRYLREARGHGSAGGLHQFQSVILEDKPQNVFVLYCDVCCTWPLAGALTARTQPSPGPHAPAPNRPAGRAPVAPWRDGHDAGQARGCGQGERVWRGGIRRLNQRATPLHRAPRDVRPAQHAAHPPAGALTRAPSADTCRTW